MLNRTFFVALFILLLGVTIGYFAPFKNGQPDLTSPSTITVEQAEDPYIVLYRNELKRQLKELNKEKELLSKERLTRRLENKRLDERNMLETLETIPTSLLTKVLLNRKNAHFNEFIKPRVPFIPTQLGNMELHLESAFDQLSPLLDNKDFKTYYATTTLIQDNPDTLLHLKLKFFKGIPLKITKFGINSTNRFEENEDDISKTFGNICMSLNVSFPKLSVQASKSIEKCSQKIGKYQGRFNELISFDDKELKKLIPYLSVELPHFKTFQTVLSYFDAKKNTWISHHGLINWNSQNDQSINSEYYPDISE